jgi:hypothetical protein
MDIIDLNEQFIFNTEENLLERAHRLKMTPKEIQVQTDDGMTWHVEQSGSGSAPHIIFIPSTATPSKRSLACSPPPSP